MAVDTPATIAILGAGPLGLEAALYARYLGYDVLIFEQGDEPAEHVRRWGHVRMFTPFGMNHSSLGLAALSAQDQNFSPPAEDELITGAQWRERYLLPLANTDLLSDHLRFGRTVLGVTRTEILKTDLIGDPERADWMFRILSVDATGREFEDEAEIVIDTTGLFSQPNWAGEGGLPALGERRSRLQYQIDYALPDILGQARPQFSGKTTLVIGNGYSAATNLVALGELASQQSETRIVWLVRESLETGKFPLISLSNDPLPSRAALVTAAHKLVAEGKVELLTGSWLREIHPRDATTGKVALSLGGQHHQTLSVDNILANVGFHPDTTLYEELQVHQCYATNGPMKLAAALLAHASADCLQLGSPGASQLLTTEPNFYLLGSKSYGRNSNFLFAHGLTQIRDLFTIIGERETLDLYANAPEISS